MSWQEQHAATLDFMAAELARALVELENLEAILTLRGREGLTVECRSFAGGVRADRDSMLSEAVALRASPPEQILPMSLTTRRVKR